MFERFPLRFDYLWDILGRSLEVRSSGFDSWTVVSPERFEFWMRYKYKVPEERWADLMEELETLNEIVRQNSRTKGGVSFTQEDLRDLIEVDSDADG